MSSYNKLQINFEPSVETYNTITEIIGINPSKGEDSKLQNDIPCSWNYEITTNEEDQYFDFINNFLDMLESKYESLAKLKIQRSNISIWLLYEYQQQCNIEFDPIRMKRLGKPTVIKNFNSRSKTNANN